MEVTEETAHQATAMENAPQAGIETEARDD